MSGSEKLIRILLPNAKSQRAYHAAIEAATGLKIVRVLGKWEFSRRKR